MKRLLDWIEKALEAALGIGLFLVVTVIALMIAPLRRLKKKQKQNQQP